MGVRMRSIKFPRRSSSIAWLFTGMLPLLGGACGLFSSKKPVLPTKPPGSSWALVEGTHDGSLLLARVRTQLGEIVRHSAYPFRVGVATPLRQLAGNGIPTPKRTRPYWR